MDLDPRLIKPPTAAHCDLQIKDFCRRVRLQALFAAQPQDHDFSPPLYVPTGWIPQRQDPELEDKLFHLREALVVYVQHFNPRYWVLLEFRVGFLWIPSQIVGSL